MTDINRARRAQLHDLAVPDDRPEIAIQGTNMLGTILYTVAMSIVFAATGGIVLLIHTASEKMPWPS